MEVHGTWWVLSQEWACSYSSNPTETYTQLWVTLHHLSWLLPFLSTVSQEGPQHCPPTPPSR